MPGLTSTVGATIRNHREKIECELGVAERAIFRGVVVPDTSDNLSSPKTFVLDPGVNRAEGKLLVNLLAEDHSRANESGKHRIVLEGYGYRWYRVGGLDYLLRRTDIAR